MRSRTVIAVGICLLTGVLSAQPPKELRLYHTNDMHSRVEAFPADYADTLLAGKGGLLRRATFIRRQRERYKDLLLLDAGDFSQGTPYYNIYRGEVEVRLMNAMGYDAATIGNHEFDYGLENMARLFRMAEFPIVCANYDVTGTVLEGLVQEYTVVERDGVRIGIFGIGPRLEGLVERDKFGGVKFEDPVSEAQRVVRLLREQEKCEVVVCLSHLGWEEEACSDVELVGHTRGIDAVIGGHSHTYFEVPVFCRDLDGKEVPVQQMGKHGAFVGEMILKLKPIKDDNEKE